MDDVEATSAKKAGKKSRTLPERILEFSPMFDAADPAFFWITLALQLTGLASIFLARLERSTHHHYCQAFFVVCLVGMGLATCTAIGMNHGCWAWCGTTFSIMAVGATFDVGGSASWSGM